MDEVERHADAAVAGLALVEGGELGVGHLRRAVREGEGAEALSRPRQGMWEGRPGPCAGLEDDAVDRARIALGDADCGEARRRAEAPGTREPGVCLGRGNERSERASQVPV